MPDKLKPWKEPPEPETQDDRNTQAVFALMQCVRNHELMMQYKKSGVKEESFDYRQVKKAFDMALNNFETVKNKKNPAVNDEAIKLLMASICSENENKDAIEHVNNRIQMKLGVENYLTVPSSRPKNAM